jgi:hypothetical protein
MATHVDNHTPEVKVVLSQNLPEFEVVLILVTTSPKKKIREEA